MTPEEHHAAQHALEEAAELLSTHDWAGFMANINRSQAMTPMLNPTLYMAGMESLEIVANMARYASKLGACLPLLRGAQEKGRRQLRDNYMPDAMAIIMGGRLDGG